MSNSNEDIRETIWEYQVTYAELYDELGWPVGYSTLVKRLNSNIALSSSRKQQIKEACERISKRRVIANHLQEMSRRDTRIYINDHGVKMKDVAQAVGISCSALSWCLSGRAKLTDKRRRDIIDAVDRLYREGNENG